MKAYNSQNANVSAFQIADVLAAGEGCLERISSDLKVAFQQALRVGRPEKHDFDYYDCTEKAFKLSPEPSLILWN